MKSKFKYCARCNVRKSMNEFRKRKYPDGCIDFIGTCKECLNEMSKNWIKRNPIKQFFCALKGRAKTKRIPFDLCPDDLVFPTHCPVLGIQLKWDGTSDEKPSVDRIDNNRGYLKNNIIIISWRANRMKNGWSIEELQKLVNFYRNLNNN